MKGARALASGMLVLALSCAIPAISAAQDAGTTTDATTTTTTDAHDPSPPPPASQPSNHPKPTPPEAPPTGPAAGTPSEAAGQLRRAANATRPRVARGRLRRRRPQVGVGQRHDGRPLLLARLRDHRRRRHGHLAQHRSGAAQRHGRRRQLQDARSEQRAERLPHLQSGRDVQLHLHDPPEHAGDDPGAELEQRRRRGRGRRFLVGLERLGELRVIGGRLARMRPATPTRSR